MLCRKRDTIKKKAQEQSCSHEKWIRDKPVRTGIRKKMVRPKIQADLYYLSGEGNPRKKKAQTRMVSLCFLCYAEW